MKRLRRRYHLTRMKIRWWFFPKDIRDRVRHTMLLEGQGLKKK